MPQKLWPFIIGVSSAWFAQIIKVFTYKWKTGKWDWKVILTSGGMPSSHASGFSAMSTSIFLQEGFTSAFTLSLGILTVVMYDAINIRWFGGVSLQKISNLTEQLVKKQLIEINKVLKQPSKSVLGHKASEVAIGLFIGVLFSYLIHIMF